MHQSLKKVPPHGGKHIMYFLPSKIKSAGISGYCHSTAWFCMAKDIGCFGVQLITSWTCEFLSHRCVFMDLALSLVEGLDSEALGMLFTTTKPALQVRIFVCVALQYNLASNFFMCDGMIVWHFVSDSHKVMATLIVNVTFNLLWWRYRHVCICIA